MEVYVFLLIVVPLFFSLLYLVKNNQKYYRVLSIAMLIFGIGEALRTMLGGPIEFEMGNTMGLVMEGVILVSEFLLLAFLYWVSLKHKKWGILSITIIQTLLTMYNLLFVEGTSLFNGHEGSMLSIDKLSLAMVLIINIIGALILVFANGYMTHYEEHRKMQSKQRLFYSVICIFLSAMNGLVLSDKLSWIYFFWEVTTITSFILISYNGDIEAMKSGFRALILNLLGGVAFLTANMLLYSQSGIETLSAFDVSGKHSGYILLPIILLCTAGFIKSAQMPFQSWLLGAMVAPTPVSALLHSSTMVNAGVYLIVKLSPVYSGTYIGTAIAVYGAVSFVICSAAAISQRNAKKVLAYSTIANLGLVISSAGMGTGMGISAAIMLIIFHAVSKALLFLCTGQIEHTIGSRDIEDMNGLIEKSPSLAMLSALGMVSMLLPPFGVLITKWLSLEASARNPLVAILLILGSALTTVFWLKWLGTILSRRRSKILSRVRMNLFSSGPLWILGGMITLTSIYITPIYNYFVSPAVEGLLNTEAQLTVSRGEVYSSIGHFNGLAIILILIVTTLAYLFIKKLILPVQIKRIYMCGENISSIKGEAYFRTAGEGFVRAEVSNFYLTGFLSEAKLTEIGLVISITVLIYLLAGGLI